MEQHQHPLRNQNKWLKYLVVRSGLLEASQLNEKEKKILTDLAEDKSMKLIGAELNISGARVGQLAAKAVFKLSNKIAELVGKPIKSHR